MSLKAPTTAREGFYRLETHREKIENQYYFLMTMDKYQPDQHLSV
jgi:hypothetical protein